MELLLQNETLAKEAQPGQFVHINVGSEAHILRRPISICDAYDDITRIVFEVKGDGTKILSGKNVGDTIDLLGPLGTGFTVKKDAKARLIRDGIVIVDTKIATLQREKDQVREVKKGYECGLTLDNYSDIKVGDTLEVYEEVEVKR